jgi:hypothetical protein
MAVLQVLEFLVVGVPRGLPIVYAIAFGATWATVSVLRRRASTGWLTSCTATVLAGLALGGLLIVAGAVTFGNNLVATIPPTALLRFGAIGCLITVPSVMTYRLIAAPTNTDSNWTRAG